jgi:AraC family transcriptional regulator
MELYDQGKQKYGPNDVLHSAASCNWSGVAAEVRRHPAGELPPFDLKQTELCIATASHSDAIVSRRGGGTEQNTKVIRGTIWTCPAGLREEEIRISEWHETLHIYLPSSRFVELSEVRGGAMVHDYQIRYLAGLHDDLIRQIAWTLLEELQKPTPAGRVLVETLSLALTARLVQLYANQSPAAGDDPMRTGQRLDDQRLNRVLEFMAQRVEEDISIDDIANVACLSPFHFIRMFHNSMGVPPHRYLNQLRVERAKTLLAEGNTPLCDIAMKSCFSSQANFTRAFHRATGMTPGAYRNRTKSISYWG